MSHTLPASVPHKPLIVYYAIHHVSGVSLGLHSGEPMDAQDDDSPREWLAYAAMCAARGITTTQHLPTDLIITRAFHVWDETGEKLRRATGEDVADHQRALRTIAHEPEDGGLGGHLYHLTARDGAKLVTVW